MLRSLLCIAALSIGGTTALAQTPGDSPYAGLGGSGWPPFYKPLKVHPRDQLYYSMGWCRTNHYHYKPSDLVDVDRLPKVTASGEVVKLHEEGLIVRLVDSPKSETAVHVQSPATRTAVRGRLPVASLKPGMYVEITGETDRQGRLSEPVEQIERVTQAVADRPDANSDGKHVGKVLRLVADRLVMSCKSGPARTITAPITADTQVVIESDDFRLATIGARVKLEGHIYRADDRIPNDQVFATELNVELSAGPEKAQSNR
jgi:hypothetical protein